MFVSARLPLLLLSACTAGLLACDEAELDPTPAEDAGIPVLDLGLPDDSGVVEDAGVSIDAEPKRGLGVLGYDSHDIAQVELYEISGVGGLRVPRDLDFNPSGDRELWVVNRADDSTVTYFKAGTPEQTAEKRIDSFALHFMEEVSSIAFGAPSDAYGHTFGTCQESRNTYNNSQRQNDFMGPSLWPSRMDIYSYPNPDAVRDLMYDLGSHLDMLHQSPLCMGIAWDHDNVYWTFDGLSGTISRYDFQADHGVGYDDHSDGIIGRYIDAQVLRVADVPSHLELDRATGKLYIADTGNARIAVLDTTSGTRGRTLRGFEPGVDFHEMTGATFTTLVDGVGGELTHPSGIVMVGDILYVTDNATSRISAFDKNTGARLDYLNVGVGAGSLMGITADPEGRLYFVDAVSNKVWRIASLPE